MPIVVVFGDRQYLDTEMTPAQFYDMLRQSKVVPRTAGSLPGPFLEAYQRASLTNPVPHRAGQVQRHVQCGAFGQRPGR